MSLADKVIKNTFYYFISQVLMILMPLFLTPFIISKIGDIQFGIYALVLGFIGTFGLLDLSISSSFVKFISQYYHKNNFEKLNHTITTGMLFYFVLTLALTAAGFLLTDFLISLINVPPELTETAVYVLRVSLLIFFVTNSFGIFGSVLISLQKMYISSMINVFFAFLNFIAVILLLNSGFGLYGIVWAQLITITLNVVITFIFAMKSLPEMKIRFSNFKLSSLKEMGGFGLQMQVSKLSSFASDKYDELLLGIFSVLNNVTMFNIGGRIVRFGKFIPIQIITQIAPVAAELNSKDETGKLKDLFSDATKYLVAVSSPLFIFIFVFSDLIISSWMGAGYETASLIIKVLITGQLVNIALSAPGNSITPNIGIPKFQMYEGLIHLFINVCLTYFLIKLYGVIGAAYGNTLATIISSSYIFYVSVRYFGKEYSKLFSGIIFPPLLASAASVCISYLIYYFVILNIKFIIIDNRVKGITALIILGLINIFFYSLFILKADYLNDRDKNMLKKLLYKFIPLSK